MAFPSSVNLPRVGGGADGDRPVRLLRLRADQDFLHALRPGSTGESARLRIPCREPVQVGDPIHAEISFGALADEVTLEGLVCAVSEAPGTSAPQVEITIPEGSADRIRYIRDVIGGNQQARARSHRRVPVDLVGRWSAGGPRHSARILDLSPGGAFVTSRTLPRLGATIELEVWAGSAEDGALRLEGATTWLRSEGTHGFGVRFRLRDRDVASSVRELVRRLDAEAAQQSPR